MPERPNFVLLVVVLVALLRKAPHGRSGLATQMERLSSTDHVAVKAIIQSEWKRLSFSLVAGFIAAAIMWQLGGTLGGLYGLPYAVAGGVGALVGLFVMNVWPRTRWPSDERMARVAEVTPRGVSSFGKQWLFVLPLGAAVALMMSLILTGIYSSTDENGLYRIYERRSLSGWGVENGQIVDLQYNMSSTGPFPGWYYGVPLIICTLLFIAAVYWSLRRTALAPRPTDANLFAVDTALRTLRTRFVMATSSAALGLQIAGVGVTTGIALRSSHLDSVPTTNFDVAARHVAVEPGYTLAVVLIFGSLAVGLAAVVLLLRAASAVLESASAGRAVHDRTHHEAR